MFQRKRLAMNRFPLKLCIIAITIVSAILYCISARNGSANDGMVTAKTIKVVMMGDSTTLSAHSAAGHKLTDCVQAGFDRRLSNETWRVTIVNAGKGCDTANGAYERLEKDVISQNPDVITISFGLNDAGFMNPEWYRKALEKLINAVRGKTKAKIMLVTSTPFDNARHGWGTNTKFVAAGGLDEYLDTKILAETRSLAKTYSLPLCDLHKEFKNEFAQDPELIKKMIRPDGVHLTHAGNALAGKYLVEAIYSVITSGEQKEK